MVDLLVLDLKVVDGAMAAELTLEAIDHWQRRLSERIESAKRKKRLT